MKIHTQDDIPKNVNSVFAIIEHEPLAVFYSFIEEQWLSVENEDVIVKPFKWIYPPKELEQ